MLQGAPGPLDEVLGKWQRFDSVRLRVTRGKQLQGRLLGREYRYARTRKLLRVTRSVRHEDTMRLTVHRH